MDKFWRCFFAIRKENYVAPLFVEASWFESDRGGGFAGELSIVIFSSFGGRNVADRLQQLQVVEPLHPLQRGQFDDVSISLVQVVDRLRQGIVVTVAFAVHRGL